MLLLIHTGFYIYHSLKKNLNEFMLDCGFAMDELMHLLFLDFDFNDVSKGSM